MPGVRATHLLLAVALAPGLLGAAGCFYVDPINERPSAEIERVGDGLVFRNQPLALRALVDDPNGDVLRLAWRAQACDRAAGEPGFRCAVAATGVDRQFTFTVPATVDALPTQQVYIDLAVTDERGAVARPAQGLALAVSNRAPLPEIQRRGRELDGRFPVGVPITISAIGADADGDPVALAWQLFPAATSQPGAAVFERAPDPPLGEAYTLIPDVAGDWIVRVTADDGTEPRTADLTIVVQPDHAPCLGATDPGTASVVLALAPRRFAVLAVDDDLDVHPAPPPGDPYLGATGFTWSLRPVGAAAFTPIATGVGAVDFDPAAYAPGDRLELRVDITDRRTDRPNNCAPEAATCSIEPPVSCQQRRTWIVEAR